VGHSDVSKCIVFKARNRLIIAIYKRFRGVSACNEIQPKSWSLLYFYFLFFHFIVNNLHFAKIIFLECNTRPISEINYCVCYIIILYYTDGQLADREPYVALVIVSCDSCLICKIKFSAHCYHEFEFFSNTFIKNIIEL